MLILNKLRKLKLLINYHNIHLKNPLHWIILITLGFRFFLKHGLKSHIALRDSFHKMQFSMVKTHAQIWEHIKPTHYKLTKMRLTIPKIKKHYAFSIIIPSHNNDTVFSIEKQIYNKFEILFGTPQETIDKISGDYVLFLQSGDFLHPNTLFELNFELNQIDKTPPFIYFDHDYFLGNTIDKPYYKPGWSPDLLLVNNYINRACVFKRDLLSKIEVLDQPFYVVLYDIILKLSEFDAGHHKPSILLTIPEADDERPYDPLENIVRTMALMRRGIDGKIESNKYGMASLKRNLIGNPKISIVIPTCYTESFIENCLKSIRNVTTYNNYEIIIVDNSRKAPNYGADRLKYFNCNILYVNEPFNWSRLNNLGAKEASGELLVFINDDTEITTPDWLERLAVEAQRPEVGITGPTALYPDGSVYSSGIYISTEKYLYIPFLKKNLDCTDYHNFLHYICHTTIVHGVCFMVEKRKFDIAGGFDESFPIGHNEAAFSFQIIKCGYYNLVLSDVNIIHYDRSSLKNVDVMLGYKHLLRLWSSEFKKLDIHLNPYLESFFRILNK